TPASTTHRPRLLRRPACPLRPGREPFEFLINMGTSVDQLLLNQKLGFLQHLFWWIWISASWMAFGMIMSNQFSSSLRWATGCFAVITLTYYGAYIGWHRIYLAGQSDGSPRREGTTETVAGGARFIVTVVGVLIGLIFASLRTEEPSLSMKVGLVSLGVSMVVGIILFIVTSSGLVGSRAELAAGIILNTALLSLTYGLSCVVSDMLARK
ncbi:hypothetical protein ABT154_24330, partial [Streptomyces sp. NPDC001728]|uniref:hypothetical protein n=1 Tax=Streptomyces sp. NPDC001728 TaxID=3154396 RepID=UPI003326D0E1